MNILDADTRSLTLRRYYAAPPARLFRAWTRESEIMKWFGGPLLLPSSAEINLRKGGHWSVHFRSPELDDITIGGEYLEIVENQRLVFTFIIDEGNGHLQESVVSVSFGSDGTGTMLDLQHELKASGELAPSVHSGWTSSLERLETLV